jgi:hypothetical protein
MNDFPVLLARINDLWYALPLIVSVSLVYAGTRFEDTDQIVRHAVRTGVWIAGFMAIILGLLVGLSWLA